ncbi:tryptophan 7-halogenase [Alteromonadaceae bacterium BrNp21-10]|nr:tryptophan 7-halogenase [Alteromonadaceae bacterium BrNp21-10]
MTQSAPQHLTKIVIVGGGTAGWISASMLAFKLRNQLCQVELIESADIGTIGVGEATIPPFITLLRNLGINEQDFISKTQGSFKLGIEFANWREKGQQFFHPFGDFGPKLDGHDFYQCWLKSQAMGDNTPIMDYCPTAIMAYQHKFMPPFMAAADSPIQLSNYALHFDASLVAKYLRDYAQGLGVVRHEDTVVEVHNHNNGFIKALQLQSGKLIEGDLFIDCSGFRGLLIDKNLNVKYQDWKQWLPCDRAVAMQTKKVAAPVPYTQSTAEDAGWRWTIPLQHRTGNGYVYSSEFCSDEQALTTLQQKVIGMPVNDPRVIPFSSGRREHFWHKNCVSVGLSSGFLEPLESTAIHLITRSIHFLLVNFPDRQCKQSLVDEYNRAMAWDYEYIRDFIILHYCSTQRNDSEFWRWCQNMSIPDSLQQRISLFKENAIARHDLDQLFKPESWQCIYEGMGIRPQTYNHFVDLSDYSQLFSNMQSAKQRAQQSVSSALNHEAFLKQFCPAATPTPVNKKGA